MNRLVIFLEAKIEWQNAALWYEEQSVGLGIRFAEVIEKKIELIASTPQLFPKKKRNYREAVVNIFPFSIIFEFNQKNDEVIVVSVFHNKRNPKGNSKSEKNNFGKPVLLHRTHQSQPNAYHQQY